MLTQILANTTPPLILISGIGILLLVISNRITHVIDRVRGLSLDLDKCKGTKHSMLLDEIRIMMLRAHILRTSMISLCISILSSSFLLIFTLLEAFDKGVYHLAGSLLLVVSIVGIAIAIGALLMDVINSLRALKVDMDEKLLR
ncbi:MAG: DUF2721 domain-containing protein [Campylobacterota bacterium]|nr:DUF2721 domain-containing protein [Campylobacterota bacterium]